MITSVLGFIIWLVQLNGAVLNLAERTSVAEAKVIRLDADYHRTAVLLSSAVATQNSTVKAVAAIETRMTRNEGLIYQNQSSNGETR